MSGTRITPYTGSQMASRVLAAFPNGWARQDAATLGNFGTLLRAFGTEMAFVVQQISYLLNATRLTTETSPELDLASQDFFGDSLPRPPGMNDQSFSQLIIQNLFREAVTRPALAEALFQLTGVQPRMLEPWNIFDTGVYDSNTYWDVDTPANPARYGNMQPYVGYIETPAPQIPALGQGIPVYGYDTWYWDVPGYFFGEISLRSQGDVFATVARLKAEGTQVWVKILPATASNIVAPSAALDVQALPLSSTAVEVSWEAPTIGQSLSFQVQYRLTGTTAFTSIPATNNLSTVVANLQPATSYDFRVLSINTAGSSVSAIEETTTNKQAPGPALNLEPTQVQSTAITVTWSPPATGTPPFTYVVQYRVHGTTVFSSLSVSPGATGVTIINLQPNTVYDIDVLTSTT